MWPVLRIFATIYRNTIIRNVKFIVIIGSSGKTTTTQAIKTILGKSISKNFVSNAFGNIAIEVLSATPWEKFKVIEVGIGARGQMKLYAQMIRPDVIVITRIGLDHISNFKHKDEIREEKAKILSSLKNDGIVFLNGDDPNALKMTDTLYQKVISYGFNANNNIICNSVKLKWPTGTEIILHSKNDSITIHSHLIGRHMVYPLLASFALGRWAEIKNETLTEKLSLIKPAYGRLQFIKLKSGAFLLRDDYKSTVDSIEAALNVLEQIPAKRKLVVFGDVAYIDYDEKKFEQIAGEIARIADKAIFIHENETALLKGALKAGLSENNIILTGGKWQLAKNFLSNQLSDGDVVLIKGGNEHKFERISLSLCGEKIKCQIKVCPLRRTYCKDCSWRFSAIT